MTPTPPLIVGIAGGSGSGKTTAADFLVGQIGEGRLARICQDSYYRDPEPNCPDPAVRNYDHPDALDETLLVYHLQELRAGRPVEVPTYDFHRHRRTGDTQLLAPREIVLVEGILLFASPPVRAELDLRVFVDTDADLRLARRLRRDVRERGRTPEGVLAQWEATVRPMHHAFVEPSRHHAHVVLPETGLLTGGLDVLLGHLRHQLLLRAAPGGTVPLDS